MSSLNKLQLVRVCQNQLLLMLSLRPYKTLRWWKVRHEGRCIMSLGAGGPRSHIREATTSVHTDQPGRQQSERGWII